MTANSRPIIGITTYGRGADGRFRLPAFYVDAVRRAGGVPILLPPGEVESTVLIDLCDALVLAGGGDVDPALYGGKPHATIERVDAERDALEIGATQAALARDLPTLGICRGAQVINVALGGTLVEHLPDEVGDAIEHRPADSAQTAYPRHPVKVDEGSKLAAVMGERAVAPASWHHQALREVAPGLEVVARADDGTIEAFERKDKTWFLGVQWHPEVTAADDPTQQRLFDSLVAAATEWRRAHRP